MTALYIIGGAVLLLLAVLLLRIRIYFLFYGGVLTLEYGLFGLRFEEDLLGTEEAEILIDEIAERQRVKGAIRRKKLVKIKRSVVLKETLIILREGISAFLKRFKRYARLEKYMLKINLGTDDPSKTAVLYGSLYGAVSALHCLAESLPKKSDNCVYTEFKPDFYADKTDAAVEIGFSLRVWQFAVCLLIFLKYYGSYESLPTELRKKMKGDNTDE